MLPRNCGTTEFKSITFKFSKYLPSWLALLSAISIFAIFFKHATIECLVSWHSHKFLHNSILPNSYFVTIFSWFNVNIRNIIFLEFIKTIPAAFWILLSIISVAKSKLSSSIVSSHHHQIQMKNYHQNYQMFL